MSKHFHKYRKVNIAKKENTPYFVMQCTLPECNHYAPMKTQLSAPSLKGKISICNKCNEPFILNRRAIRMAKPICDICFFNKKNDKKLDEANKFFETLEKELLP